MVKAIILDLDGTLVDSHKAHVKSYKQVFSDLGLKEPSRQELKRLFGMIAEDIIKELFPHLSKVEVREVVDSKREIFLTLMDLVSRKPCVDLFLRKASKKYRLVIATSASPEEMNSLINNFGWTHYFELMITSYDVPKPKPAPDLLLKVVKMLGLKKSDCLFIGDSIFDALSSRNAGVSFLGVETGSFSKKEFNKNGFKSYKNLCTLTRSKPMLF